MEKKNIPKFPKGFFQETRPTITAGEALQKVKPFEWSSKKRKAKQKIINFS
jgi:hypothetical protein